ncbi:MAG: hypothetical protein AAF799_06040 [Myxococcota bacterium]
MESNRWAPLGIAAACALCAYSYGTNAHAIDPGETVDISKDGTNIVLTWTPTPGDLDAVWVSDSPNAVPGGDDSTLIAETDDGIFIDQGANNGTTRFYTVAPVTYPNLGSATAAVVPTPLFPGFTKVGLCLDAQIANTAELFADMDSNVLSAWTWNPFSQSFSGHRPWQTWSNLPFSPGQVVAVQHQSGVPVNPSSYSMVGSVASVESMAIMLEPGDNLVTLPLQTGTIMASELHALAGATRIRAWDAATQTEHRYPEDGDIELQPCQPMHVEVQFPTQWMYWELLLPDIPDVPDLPTDPPPDFVPDSAPPPPAPPPPDFVPDTAPPPPEDFDYEEVGAESADVEGEEDIEE